MHTKQVLLNLRPQDRVNQSSGYDADVNTSDCEFALSKPIIMKNKGRFYLRSAYFPITYKNVIEGYNDRFCLCFRPETSSTDDESVFITVQLPIGQYDTLSDLASAINTELAKLDDTPLPSNATMSLDGDVGFTYTSSYSGKFLQNPPTCTVATEARYKNHLKFSLPNNAAFHSATITSKDGTQIGATDLNGGMQIVFGLLDTGDVVRPIAGRTANKLLGFGNEKKELNGDVYVFSPSTPADTDGVAQTLYSDTVGDVILTPYIFVRSDLARSSMETYNKTTRITDLIGKIPVVSSGYTDANFYEADNNPYYLPLADEAIHNVRITMTDSDGRRLDLGDNEWEVSLVFEGEHE